MTSSNLPTGPLHYRTHIPEEASDGSPLLLLLHGRGADETDLFGLSSLLPKRVILVTPRGPFPGAPWGYGPGWAWYRYMAEDRVEDDTMLHSLGLVDALFEELEAQLPVRSGPRVMGGFSQGGTMSLAYALTRPGRLAGVVNFSGFLVNTPTLPVEEVDPAMVPPIFWGHGTSDAAIPFSIGEKGRGRLRSAGMKLETFDHAGGHTITGEELRAFHRWLEGVTSEE